MTCESSMFVLICNATLVRFVAARPKFLWYKRFQLYHPSSLAQNVSAQVPPQLLGTKNLSCTSSITWHKQFQLYHPSSLAQNFQLKYLLNYLAQTISFLPPKFLSTNNFSCTTQVPWHKMFQLKYLLNYLAQTI